MPFASRIHTTAGSAHNTAPRTVHHLHGVGRPIMLAVLLSPWIFGFSNSHAAVVNHIAFTLAFGPIALLVGVLRPTAYVLLLGALWLALSPWLLGYAGNNGAWLAELVSGLVLTLISASVLTPRGRLATRPTGGP
jgi:hypothetical protein